MFFINYFFFLPGVESYKRVVKQFWRSKKVT
jgi:hypothetical protein